MEVIRWKSRISRGDHTYSYGFVNDKPKYLHIDNHKTKTNSVIIRLSELDDVLYLFNPEGL